MARNERTPTFNKVHQPMTNCSTPNTQLEPSVFHGYTRKLSAHVTYRISVERTAHVTQPFMTNVGKDAKFTRPLTIAQLARGVGRNVIVIDVNSDLFDASFWFRACANAVTATCIRAYKCWKSFSIYNGWRRPICIHPLRPPRALNFACGPGYAIVTLGGPTSPFVTSDLAVY